MTVNDDNEDDTAVITNLLVDRLANLGLDAETYSGYLVPLLTSDNAANNNSNEELDEEWESVLELLQASSETHSEDPAAWQALRREVTDAWRQHTDSALAEQHERQAQREREEKEQRERDVQLAQQAELAAAAAEEQEPSATKQDTTDDAAKRALLSRFAYDDPESADASAAAAPVVTNKEYAQQKGQQQAQEARSQFKTTKREEHVKTKEARQKKIQDKEDRRKRAVKGERKR